MAEARSEAPVPGSPQVDASDVVAVVVVRGGAERALPTEMGMAALRSVLQQSSPPGVVLLAHVGQVPPTPLDLNALGAAGSDVLLLQIHTPTARNFGQAVRAALGADRVRRTPGVERARWFWLVHDDMVAEPDALANLLQAGRPSLTIAALGPKQVDYEQPDRLLELGVRATGSSRRVDDILVDEIDQGQYDDREEVLAVGTAGMLVRKSVWDSLDGLDPALGPFGDGLEFGRRVRRAGHRVVVVPRAKVRHRQSSHHGATSRAGSFEGRRAAQLYNWCVSTPAWALVPLMLWMPVLTLLRTAGRLLTRQPALALAEARAYLDLVGMSGSMFGQRRRIAAAAKVPRSALSPLHESPRAVLQARRARRKVANQRKLGAALDVGAAAALRRHQVMAAGSLITAVLVAVAISVFTWHQFRLGAVGGLWGDLPTSWTALVAQAWSGWQVSGDGAAGPADPVLLPLSVLSAPFALFGVAPIRFGIVVLFAALPLAVWGGWGATSCFTQSIPVRLAGAGLWAAGAPLMVSLVRGDLASILAYLALPALLVGLWRGLGPAQVSRVYGPSDILVVPRPDRFAWMGLAGLALLVVGAAAPGMVLLSALLAIWIAFAPRERTASPVVHPAPIRARTRWWGIVLICAPAVVWLMPSFVANASPGQLDHLWAWMAGAVPLGAPGAPWWAFLAGFQTSPVAVAGPATALVFMAAAAGALLAAWAVVLLGVSLLSPRPRWAPAVCFLLAVAMLGAAAGLSYLEDGNAASPVLMGAAGLALLATVSSAQPRVRVSSAGLRREKKAERAAAARGAQGFVALAATGATLTAVLILGPLSASWSMDEGAAQAGSLGSFAVAPTGTASFPLVAREAQESPRQARVLEVQVVDGALSALLLRGAGVQLADITGRNGNWDTENLDAVTDAESALAETAAALVSGARADVASMLQAHAIDIVLLPPGTDDAADLANTIDATEGLERIGTVEAGTMWRVRPDQQRPSRAVLELPDGTLEEIDSDIIDVKATLEPQAGTLILAETRDPAWKATLDGRELEVVETADWRQAFEVPAAGGKLQVTYAPDYRGWWVGVSALVLLLLLISVVPWRVRRADKISVTAQKPQDMEAPVSAGGESGAVEAASIIVSSEEVAGD